MANIATPTEFVRKWDRTFTAGLRRNGFYVVYVVGIADPKHPLKIGISSGPSFNSRLSGYKTARVEPVELVFHRYCAGKPIALRIEKEVHAALKGRRASGEWFKVSRESAGFLIEQAAKRLGAWLKTEHEVWRLFRKQDETAVEHLMKL